VGRLRPKDKIQTGGELRQYLSVGRMRRDKREARIGTAHMGMSMNSLIESNKQTNKHF
jgi:hypothetical protein